MNFAEYVAGRHAAVEQSARSLKAAKNVGSEKWWMQYREGASEAVSAYIATPRCAELPPPAADQLTAMVALLACVQRDRQDLLACSVIDCFRRNALDIGFEAVNAHLVDGRSVPLEFKLVITAAWKATPMAAASPSILSPVLRKITPEYCGPDRRIVYRGESRSNHRRGRYRNSWTANPNVAVHFAKLRDKMSRAHQIDPIESVVVQAEATRDDMIYALNDAYEQVIIDPAGLRDVREFDMRESGRNS